MDLGEVDLDGIEQVCTIKGKGYVPQEQVSLLHNAIMRDKAQKPLGTIVVSMKENKSKLGETSKKSGQKSNRVRIVGVGVKLVESG